MLVKEWSWDSEETADSVCFVANSLYADFLTLLEEGEISAPISAFRFPDKYRGNLDLLSLFLFRSEVVDVEFVNIQKSSFYDRLCLFIKNGLCDHPQTELNIPSILKNTEIYLETLHSVRKLCSDVSSSSVLGSHPPSGFKSDWWRADQMLLQEIGAIRRKANQLKTNTSYERVLTDFFESYVDLIDIRKLTDPIGRLTYMSAYLYSCALNSYRNGDFSQALVLTHRSLEYSLTRVCWEIGTLTERRGSFFFNNSISVPSNIELHGKKTNLFLCITALEWSVDISIAASQLVTVISLNNCRNDSKLAHGLMAPNKQTSKDFLDSTYDLSVLLLNDPNTWRSLAKTFGKRPMFNLDEMFSLESNFSDYLIKIA